MQTKICLSCHTYCVLSPLELQFDWLIIGFVPKYSADGIKILFCFVLFLVRQMFLKLIRFHWKLLYWIVWEEVRNNRNSIESFSSTYEVTLFKNCNDFQYHYVYEHYHSGIQCFFNKGLLMTKKIYTFEKKN